MSKRKGGDHKADRVRIYVKPKTHAQLLDYVQSKMKSQKGINMTLVVGMFVDKGVKQDLYDPKWEEKLVKEERALNALISEEGCHKLAKAENDSGIVEFSCVAYNEEGVVRLKNLGKVERIAQARCRACGLDREIKAGIRVRDDRIIELEKGLKSRARELYKIPVCEGGAHLTPDGTSFERCRRSNISVDVLRFCKVVENGPCAYFRETIVGVGEKK